MALSDDSGRAAFARHLRPRLAELLQSIGLDVVYHRAQGDHLYTRDASGAEVEVLDLLGGFGAALFGHNHPVLVATAREVLEAKLPFLAQASVRSRAGLLAQRLSEEVGRTTGRDYVVTLANSGTEAVEAALKHAEMERTEQNARRLERLRELPRAVRLGLRDRTVFVSPGLLEEAARRLGVPRVDTLDELFAHLHRSLLSAVESEPTFLAVERAFHGKTTGSLKLTHNPEYRTPFRRAGLKVTFLPAGDVAAVEAAVQASTVRWVDLEVAPGGRLSIVERAMANVTACFAEPIQGEGGIRELSAPYLAALRAAADAHGFPLVLDEIQSGMGRSGTFLASEPSGVRGDYYLLSKALGGGLAKISALLVDRARYLPRFGELHTSTFADDDFSSAVALRAVELVTADGGAWMQTCREKGERFLSRLSELRRRYPGQLGEVRGRGLLLGFELVPQLESPSTLLRVLSEQNLLGYVVSGYLLAVERIRVAPTLSSHATLRLEPSALLPLAELDRFCAALERVLVALRDGDALRLCGFIAGRLPRPEDPPVRAVSRRPSPEPVQGTRHIGFLAHFLEPADLRRWEPSFEVLTDEECERFLQRTRGLLEPFVVDRARACSASGDEVELTVFGVPFLPAQVVEALREGDADWALALVKSAVEQARLAGCSVLGFGGYTSIVTDNCRAVVEDEMTLTSGNTLTAAAALEALFLAARRVGVSGRRLGVVGAAGNIGAVLAEVAADQVPAVLLVGRPGTQSRLERAAAELCAAAYDRLLRGERGGLAGSLAATRTAQAVKQRGPGHAELGWALWRGLSEELGDESPLRVSTELSSLRGCDLVLSATNAARPIILPEHLAQGPLVVCDVAAPRDVDLSVVRERPSAVVLRGGMVRAPRGQDLGLTVLRLSGGQLYGCLAETLLLGMAGLREHFSYGRLTAARVRRIAELARAHGFTVDEDRVTS